MRSIAHIHQKQQQKANDSVYSFMADFKIALERTKVFEGGYSANPNDAGNWSSGERGKGILVGTKYGISAPVLAAYLKKSITAADMKNMPIDTATEIYRANYWNLIKGDIIKDQGITNQLFDMAVNSGVRTAINILQRRYNIPLTGYMDSDTLKFLNNEQ